MKSFISKSEKNLVLREAVKKDAAKLITYIREVAGETEFLTFAAEQFSVTVEQQEMIIEDIANSDNNLMIIAEVQGKIIGNIVFRGGQKPRNKHTGEFGVTVLKNYWGMGIASELIRCMVDWAKETNSIKKVNLRVRSDNNRAVELYSKFGFQREGIVTRDFFVGDEFYDSILMGLIIE